ncbi:26S proteasome subunit RPN7 [Zalerion maritima]|uniref:26S proteasome subunit RPN7 n=1 Tax=Zalerion maritima TaxID=339359 RepID=A0AAD5RZ60_9PEZI|nr:26S proteasome subunit RPN7 [Zalerion maritima]
MANSTDHSQEPIIVQETPKLDLDLYMQNYKGRTRCERLIFIGACSVALRVEALKAAVSEAKQGKDVSRYKKACALLQQVAPSEPEAQVDSEWVSRVNHENNSESKRLSDQLSGYKHNLIKESIRMGLDELGKHLEYTGDLNGALEMYTKMRADVSTTKQLLETHMLISRIHLQNREWSTALGTATKLTGQVPDEKEFAPFVQWVRVVQAVCTLGTNNYEQAAQHFLKVNSESHNMYSNVASPNDIAIYGGLLALATMDRDQLQNRVLDDQNFRTFLELEPHIRRAIGMFVNSRFSSCLSILEAYKPDYLLDIYLQPHVKAIYSLIRRKCIVQYMIPFSCVTMDRMQEQFGHDGESLEEELAQMIRSGDFKARINSVDRVLTRERTEPRMKMQAKGLDAINMYEKEALERLRKMSIAAAELEVRGMRKGSVGLPSFQNIHDKLINPAELMASQEQGGGGM